MKSTLISQTNFDALTGLLKRIVSIDRREQCMRRIEVRRPQDDVDALVEPDGQGIPAVRASDSWCVRWTFAQTSPRWL
jgi:hypothetical protein